MRNFSIAACAGAKILFILFMLFTPLPLQAIITGTCSDCHTMHNSQDGLAMTLDGGGANPMLLRGSCIGCHAQNSGQKIVNLGGNQFPQVMHNDASGDLAAGNFAYINGSKGSGALDSKGHNVIDLVGQDSQLDFPPGPHDSNHQDYLASSGLTCAGNIGCHGYRLPDVMNNDGLWGGTGLKAIKTAHHRNVDGLITGTPPDVGDSYRFLDGVIGLENPDPDGRWQNKSSSSHNEYFGLNDPGTYTASNFDKCERCHAFDDNVRPSNRTISGFCATCHPGFHGRSDNSSTGIGTNVTSPFLRHPTDIVIKNSGEYAGFTSYNINVPVGRQVLTATPSATVTPGSDTITCLSCHVAHASDYPDMLRWDYTDCLSGVENSACGCFTCHTSKD